MKNSITIAITLMLITSVNVFSQNSKEGKLLLNLLSHPEHAQGEMAGMVTSTSVLLQSRLTLTNWQFNNDYIGCKGWARFMVYTSNVKDAIYTEWKEAIPENDYIIKTVLKDLKPNTGYSYRLQYGRDKTVFRTGQLCEFRTHPGADISANVSFAVTTGMNYDKFYNHPERKFYGVENELGFPAAEAVTKLRADFFVGTGDNVYYDSNFMPFGQGIDANTMRNYFHLQFGQPRMVELFSSMASYWEKDDHDYRYNDADTTGKRAPSHQLGIDMHKEQLPVTDPDDKMLLLMLLTESQRKLKSGFLKVVITGVPTKMLMDPEKQYGAKSRKSG